MDRRVFFDMVRNAPFPGRLDAGQVEGLNILLDAMGHWPLPWVAYGLATSFHEVGGTMQPVRETLAGTDALAVARLDRAWAAGRMPQVKSAYWRFDADGKSWLGRGYVQLTHRENYLRAARALGHDLVGNPNLAMRADIAAAILVRGMTEGWFAGDKKGRHTMARHLDGVMPDYVNARRIINGTDKASLIAGQARAFEKALRLAGYRPGQAAPAPQPAPVRIPPPPDIPAPEPQPANPPQGFWARFWQSLTRRMKG
jgi:hypothetical protein